MHGYVFCKGQHTSTLVRYDQIDRRVVHEQIEFSLSIISTGYIGLFFTSLTAGQSKLRPLLILF